MTTPYPTRRTGLGRPLTDIVGASEDHGDGAGRLLAAPGVVPLDLVPFPMLVADPVGRVLAVNQHWVRLTGLTESQSMGSGWLAALLPQDRAALGSLVQAVGEGQPGTRAEFPLAATGHARFGWWMVAHQRAGERLVGIAVGEAAVRSVAPARSVTPVAPVAPGAAVAPAPPVTPAAPGAAVAPAPPVTPAVPAGLLGRPDPVTVELSALLHSLEALLSVLDRLVSHLEQRREPAAAVPAGV